MIIKSQAKNFHANLINRCLDVSPKVINAAIWSPHDRVRNIWWDENLVPCPLLDHVHCLKLQNVLDKDRLAVVQKLHSVTKNSESTKIGEIIIQRAGAYIF